MMPIRQWPTPILRRWLVLPAIGLGCFLIGSAAGLAFNDRFLFYLSTAVCVSCLVKAFLFYRLAVLQDYDVIEGVCMEVQPRPFRRGCAAKFADDAGRVHTLALEKGIRVCAGRPYRLYLRKRTISAEAEQALPFHPAAELLGYEEVEVTPSSDKTA